MKPRAAIGVLGGCVAVWAAMVALRIWMGRAASAGPSVAEPAPAVPAGTRAVVHLPDLAGWAADASGAVFGWATSGRVPLSILAVLTVGGWLVKVVRVGVRLRATAQDPTRMYSSEQRREAFARAGDRCEYTGLFGRRCRSGAEHADHAFPWKLGGATSLDNCVASCARHNLSKGAKVLTRRQVRRLEHRRRGYFPPGADVNVERRYVDASAPAGSPAPGRTRARTRGAAEPAAVVAARVPSPWSGDDQVPAVAFRVDEIDEAPAGW